eukprot:1139498-Pelagomonas_calceolata.AAC.2
MVGNPFAWRSALAYFPRQEWEAVSFASCTAEAFVPEFAIFNLLQHLPLQPYTGENKACVAPALFFFINSLKPWVPRPTCIRKDYASLKGRAHY